MKMQIHRPFAGPARTARGFTIVELLLVIAILTLLAALIAGGGAAAISHQKATITRQVMNNVTMAIEQFRTEDPLKQTYGRRSEATFGDLPPYMLKDRATNGGPARVFEPLPGDNGAGPNALGVNSSLVDRLSRDLGGPVGSAAYARMTNSPNGKAHSDVRSLYAYMRVFSPGVLKQIPDANMKYVGTQPNNIPQRDSVNPTGSGPNPGQPDSKWLDVLGFVDGWGVPMDYVIYAKIEYGPRGFRVVDRRPALRSRGMDAETYEARIRYNANLPPPVSQDIWSEELPTPAALFQNNQPNLGRALNGNQNPPGWANGWVRLIGGMEASSGSEETEDYPYASPRPPQPPP